MTCALVFFASVDTRSWLPYFKADLDVDNFPWT